MTRRLFIFLCLLIPVFQAQAQPTPTPAVFAIVGAKIEIGDGRVIEKGTVVLRDGLIQAVGANVQLPLNAEIIKGDGLVVYPGFIDAYSARGLKLPDAQPDQDKSPPTGETAPASMREANRKGVRPEIRAVDCLDLNDALLNTARRAGFTTVHLAPGNGTINGVTGLVNLSGQPKRYAVIKNSIGMDCAFRSTGGGFGGGGGGGGGYPGSLMGIIAHFRQTMLDAQHFRLERNFFEKKGGPRPPADDSLAALLPVLERSLPVVFDADTAIQINRAFKLADEFNLRLMVNGGSEAYKSADTLKKRDVPILLGVNFGPEPGVRRTRPGGGRQNEADRTAGASREDDPDAETPKAVLDDQKRLWKEGVECAASLHKAGVPFAFTTKGLRDVNDYLPNVRRAVQSGLPRDAALQAMTLNSAKMFGVEKQLGTVEAGKIAALTVMTGDFMDEKAKVRYLFVDTEKFDMERMAPTPRPRPMGPPADDDEDHPHP